MLLAAELALPPRPALVVLIRHGHKDAPGGSDHSGTANYNLSSIGLAQAQRLAAVVPTCLQESRPLHLISHGFHPDSGKNARSYQTLVPLAISSGVNIRMLPEAEADSRGSGNRLLADPQYGGGVMVIAWEHRRLPQLARGLGWPSMPTVDDDDFDSLWLLRYEPGLASPVVRRFSQQALARLDCARSGVVKTQHRR
jgi:hypothetical protein